ncbi:MAG: putative addiction module component [Mucilaginibacter sp.]|nr:putative addiction module component [Mucilaginibacter sp.]
MTLDGNSNDYEPTDEQKAELDRRFSDYKNGIGKTYTWDEVIVLADQALEARKK